MSYSIQGGREDRTLEYDVSDAASGAPMRITVAGGVLALVYDHGMIRVSMGGADKRQPMGFYVPALPALTSHADVVIVPELSLQQVGVYDGNIKAPKMHGVGDVAAQVVADPQRGGQAAVYLSFSAVGTEAMVLRYRVTLYRPR